MTVQIRRLRWWDLERVLPLERELFPDDPWSAETFWAELAQAERRHYVLAEDVAEDRAVLVGYAGLLAGRENCDVQTLAVATARQGHGLGRRLLTELLDEAARRGCDTVLLEVRATNASAQALYRHAGFERIGVRRGYYQPGGDDAVVMRLRGVRRRTVHA